ncbi:murein L,D-transpeptidase [Salinivibrio sp. ES.052]|uniref:L,D-transpeptidase family protein n=1 Tax=Salinivibrio sp. ES.052 TaxID=1882823 RepID=UPI000927FED9|nr:L,D-transpeptidase family protein [Salinivibrio sp. ES.052]SIN83875.1 Murein L,D-transpeptidase YcbB/YkuD [Salinivibrio sp. ES.052]
MMRGHDACLANLLIVFCFLAKPVGATDTTDDGSIRFLVEKVEQTQRDDQTLSADAHRQRAYQYARDWIEAAAPDATVLAYASALTEDYLAHGFSLIWTQPAARDELETQVNVISLAGFSPEFEWRAWQLRQLRAQNSDTAYDIFATDTAYALLSYLGAIPDKGMQWFFGASHQAPLAVPSPQLRTSLFKAGLGPSLTQFLRKRRPQHPQYRALIKQIIRLQDQAQPVWPSIPADALIYPDQAITTRLALNLVDNLRLQGFWDGSKRLEAIDGKAVRYRGDLREAVETFQQRHGLTVDGIIGPSTAKWFNLDAKSRIRLLALNAERLRLWPNRNPDRIVVNIPDYRMRLWHDDQNVFESKVVVGRQSRRTPLFSSMLDSVVLNPSWNVPRSIVQRDILPKLADDQQYLSQHQYRILPNWQSDTQIDPSTIDWKNVRTNGFPYRLQQAPGHGNALGQYKFNTPNRNAIYLHDTPAQGLFNRSRRAFSSGCIRVEQAEQLADLLLDLSGQKLSDYQGYLDKIQTKWVPLQKRLSVQTIYQTAWVTEEGKVAFRDDVYAYDVQTKREVTTQEPHYLTQQRDPSLLRAQ